MEKAGLIVVVMCRHPLSQHLFEPLQEEVGFVHRQAQGRQQTDDVGAADAGEYVLFLQQTQAQVLDGSVELQTDHQATTAHFLDLRQLLQFVQQIRAYTGGVNMGLMSTPAMGKPLPMPLATVMRSGRMP